MDIQKQYWRFLVQLKAWVFYLNLYADSSYKWQRRLDIFTAIASSVSIGTWAIWKKFDLLWATIIALSQVINIVKQHLPFSKRLEIINPFNSDLQSLFCKAEYDWFKVANGDLKVHDINNLLYDLKTQYCKIERKYIKQNDLLENKKFLKIANSKTDEYFTNNFYY